MIVWAVPSALLFWSLNPESLPIGLKLACFLLSIGVAIVYYHVNPGAITSVADKVSFFSGVSLGPVTVLSVFF